MKLSKSENQALAELSRVFRARFGAKEVCLYGSAARGQMDAGSDIDIFLVLPEVNWQIEKEIIKLCFDAELKCGRVFSAVCYSVDDIENSPLKESPLVLNVRKQGRRL
ncbi:MAG: nucleotidyltransferase domain-containing protein [Phycisphaerae bacterium]|nr:nucleotidyltransferase domain-containing protein [Phycisphaerae bacterium]